MPGELRSAPCLGKVHVWNNDLSSSVWKIKTWKYFLPSSRINFTRNIWQVEDFSGYFLIALADAPWRWLLGGRELLHHRNYLSQVVWRARGQARALRWFTLNIFTVYSPSVNGENIYQTLWLCAPSPPDTAWARILFLCTDRMLENITNQL